MSSGLSDTIAAVATAPGAAGVGIVRVSGPGALAVADAVFRGRQRPSTAAGGRFLYGQFWHAGEQIDDGLCLVFRAPHSYSGEEVAEWQCHGSPAVLAALLQAALAAGARLARPGEFTLRAYLNGRLDLAQAEAVGALVGSTTTAARRQAVLGLTGALAGRLGQIQDRVTGALAHLQAMLDYPEEGVPEAQLGAEVRAAQSELRALIATARAGEVARRGARLAIIGRPNAGKSSLLNALLGYERSIVTPIPGTTRDYLEAVQELAGVPVTLIDTAGLRETSDPIEAAGVAQARRLGETADLTLYLEDGHQPRGAPDEIPTGALRVQTKADLPAAWHDPASLPVSAVTGAGLPELRDAVANRLLGDASGGEVWLGSERQADAARRAEAHLGAALTLPDDLASLELEAALEALSEISGRDVREDVVDGVFRGFCVGK